MYISISDKGGHRILQRQRHAIAKQVMVVAASAVVLGSVLGCQPQVQTIVVEKPKCELREFRSSTKFVTEAWAIPDNRFNVGEPLRLQMRVSSPVYMNVFHVGTSCKVTRLVHNRTMTAGNIVDFPAPGIDIVVKPPPGGEAFYFVATRAELKVFAKADILAGDEIASLDLTPEEFFVRLDQVSGRINPDDLSITTLRTRIFEN